jgi:hypothetical protein
MYTEDHRFGRIEDESAKIWRYMSMEKYKDMLGTSSLYFCRGEEFQKADPYEGSYLSFELLKTAPTEKAVVLAQKMKSCGPPITVNCWHLNEFESLAMWRLYENTIAIQSTVGRLIKALLGCPFEVRIGRVHYIMPGEDPFTSNSVDVFTPWLHKHRGFEYEKELRAVIWDVPASVERETDGSVRAPIDVDALIECVYIAPRAEAYVKDHVGEINRTHKVVAPIRQSKLAKPPIY